MKRLAFLQKPLFQLMQGSFWGGLIAFLGSQGVAYLYGPSIYGQYAVALAFISTLGVIPSLKLELAGFKQEREGLPFPLRNVLQTIAIVSLPLLVLLWWLPFGALKSSWNYLASLKGFLLAGVVLFSLNQLAQFYLLHGKRFSAIRFYRILVPVVIYGIALCLGWWHNAAHWLYAAWIVGWVAGALFVLVLYAPKRKSYSSVWLKDFWQANLPLIRFELPSSLLMLLANYLPLFLVSLYFGWQEAGMLALGLRLTDLLIQYYSQNAQQVILGTQESVKSPWSIGKLIWKESAITFLFFTCLLLGFAVAQYEHWLPAAWQNLFEVLMTLIGWKWGQALYTPISAWLIQHQKNQWGLLMTGALLVVPVLSIAIFPQQFFSFLWSLSGGYFFVYLLGVILISQLAKKTA